MLWQAVGSVGSIFPCMSEALHVDCMPLYQTVDLGRQIGLCEEYLIEGPRFFLPLSALTLLGAILKECQASLG